MSDRPTSPHEWASRIRAELRETAAGILAVGRLFLAAKTALKHGEFTRMFIDLPINQRMAEMYMSIAKNPALTNPKHVSLLPPAISTLYRLSRESPLRLEAALAEGSIHPQLQREDARALFTAVPPPPARWSLADCEEHLRQLINEEITRAPEEARE